MLNVLKQHEKNKKNVIRNRFERTTTKRTKLCIWCSPPTKKKKFETQKKKKTNGKKKKKKYRTKWNQREELKIIIKKNTINALCGLAARSVITCLFIIIIFMYIGLYISCRTGIQFEEKELLSWIRRSSLAHAHTHMSFFFLCLNEWIWSMRLHYQFDSIL